ncbi:MAG: glycine--tRNA ligase, partial [Candidatus Aenigmatarchaeota archaeon]
ISQYSAIARRAPPISYHPILDKISKKRGFIWQSSDLYGGLSGFFDYGHLGTLMKKKFEDLWRNYFLDLSPNYFEIDTSNVLSEDVLKASGHLEHFTDPLTVCSKCGNEERADELLEKELDEKFEGLNEEELSEIIEKHDLKCPKCGGKLKEVGQLNITFPLTIGSKGGKTAYLRPETAQGTYLNFLREFKATRKKMPLGLASIGKAYRNEISPRQGVFRAREFTQAELQVFIDPENIDEEPRFDDIEDVVLRLYPVSERDSGEVLEMKAGEVLEELDMPRKYVYFMAKIQQFYLDELKIPREKFRFEQLNQEERAFYNKYHWDIELDMESLGGFKEVAGLHYRTDHDLKSHQDQSGESQEIFYDDKRFVPHVIEVSFGVDRNVYGIMDLSLVDDKRTYFSMPREVSPYDVGILPLVTKDSLPEKAEDIRKSLTKNFDVSLDSSGTSIGKRYRRMDEVGVPLVITVDYDTMEDDTVTIRERDSMEQIRVSIEDLEDIIGKFLEDPDCKLEDLE